MHTMEDRGYIHIGQCEKYIGLYRIEDEYNICKIKDRGYIYIGQCKNYIGLYRIEEENNIYKMKDKGYIYPLGNGKNRFV